MTKEFLTVNVTQHSELSIKYGKSSQIARCDRKSVGIKNSD